MAGPSQVMSIKKHKKLKKSVTSVTPLVANALNGNIVGNRQVTIGNILLADAISRRLVLNIHPQLRTVAADFRHIHRAADHR